jgi:hypothetical protein
VTLNTTEEHPFLVRFGATADADDPLATGHWVQAASLKPGDEIRTASGEPAVVVTVQFTGRRATVYNIEVEGLHNYQVGPEGVVVHNSLCNLAEGLGAVMSSATRSAYSSAGNLQYEKGGGLAQQAVDLASLLGSNAKASKDGKAVFGLMADGSKVTSYPVSKSTGGPTIKIEQPDGVQIIIRYQ